MKRLFVVLDGLGDKRYRELQGKTPFEYALTPNMDFLRRKGEFEMRKVIRGVAPESDEAMLALLGYDVFKVHRGRGILEAYGAGVKFEKGDVVFRANFAKLDDKGNVSETGAVPSKDYISRLGGIRWIDDVKARFVKTKGHRGVLILHGKGLRPKVTNTNPSYKVVKGFVSSALPKNKRMGVQRARALDDSSEAKRTADIVNRFTGLSKFKNNIILLRGGSNELPRLRRMKNWALISEMPVEIGIGKCAKMRIIKPERRGFGLAGQIDRLLKKYNVYVQIKGADAYAHKGDLFGKIRAIEEVDRMIGGILEKIRLDGRGVKIVMTADHSTRCDTRAHSSLAVPFIACRTDNF